ncbi:MAG: efflux RND transporter periplasmic adaptor subunit [bacterium]
MKTKTGAVLSIAILSALAFVHCGDEVDGKNEAADGRVEKVTDVKIMEVQPQTFVDFIEVTGTVKADVRTTVSAEESGTIEAFFKDKGDVVKKGELVLKLKSKVLQAGYDEARASYLLSKATFERQANLYNDHVISEQKYLEYKYSLDRDRARYQNLKARLAKTEIRSPIYGTIEEKLAEIGEFVLPSTPLFQVVKTDRVKISAGVPENYVATVKLGSATEVTFDIFPGEQFDGQVTFVGPSINEKNRTFPVEIEMANQEGRLKPAMFANVKIVKTELNDVVVIPRDAVIESEKGKYVFVATGNVATRRNVIIGGAQDNRIFVKAGLSVGEKLIVVGHRDLVDGERIAIHDLSN